MSDPKSGLIPARVPKTLHIARTPKPDVEQMIDNAKTGLSHQIARLAQKMALETLDPKEMSAFKSCVDALEKLARLEGVGVSAYDLGDLKTEELEKLVGGLARQGQKG